MSNVLLTDLIAPAFYGVHHDLKQGGHNEYLLEGGRGSCKSTFVGVQIPRMLISDPLSNYIVYRKVAETLRESVYPQIVWAIDKMGLNNYFKLKLSPLEITYEPTGQRILFKGADDPGKSKSIKLAKGYFKGIWFEELTEFYGMDEIRTIKESIIRGVDKAYTFYTYNPPKSANNWVNTEALIPTPGRLVHHSDYRSVPREWLGEAFITEAEIMREVNPRAYEHTYLGHITGTGGQVFDNVTLRGIGRDEYEKFDDFIYGGDFGFANDPDAVIKMYYSRREQTLYLLGEVYGIRMNIDMLADRVKDLAGRDYVTYDNEDPRMINELTRRGCRILSAKKGPGSVEHGIRWLQDLKEIVIDPSTCPNAAREFTGYEYKRDRHGNFLSSYPDLDNHTIDAVRYGCEMLIGSRLGFVDTISDTVARGKTDRIFKR